ncbi:hypothetical protein GpartN1_g4285.t1 [Galdieria partita]|uniref:Uncharacterized protein n=1 Tax=Galdieria partita TaxID=83374 RepID=A0A9C7PYZ3_9RHOD|nr:hypothetical protein GpartN1_g4258.t1 [Galdieria partita]GJQ12494.1 hypothetical protein GpartN1_g4285.t1 [Galdieria partita]
MIENNQTEVNESFSEEDVLRRKEKELQTLSKIREYTQEILEQLKLRIKTFEKYETILADSTGTISQWREVFLSSTNILNGEEYVKVSLKDMAE